MNTQRATYRFGGWPLFWLLSALVVAMTAIIILITPDSVDGIREAIRATARTSLALFLAAFLASSLAILVPGPMTKALVRERRFLGLAFAFSHFVHAIVIYSYWKLAPDLLMAGRTWASSAPGTVGYVFIILLSLTSFKATTRMIGAKAWKVLHTTGMWVLAGVFALSFFKRIPMSYWYAIPFAIVFCAAVLRGVARLAKNARRSARTASAA
ncbi:MAG: hypothetical protein ACOH2R_05340 [Pseudomonas sp.]